MDELSRLIGQLYDCWLKEADWSATMATLADYCGAANAARTHLNRVSEKTGMTRQAELTRMLADPGLT